MLVTAVLAILTIFAIVYVIKTIQNSSDIGFFFACIAGVIVIFVLIWSVIPTKWGEVKLDAEYDLMPFVANGGNEYYASMGEGSYTIYLDNNRPTTISTDEVTSVVYITENETPKVCRYIQQNEWTWYAPPLREDRVTYILFVPEDGIVY